MRTWTVYRLSTVLSTALLLTTPTLSAQRSGGNTTPPPTTNPTNTNPTRTNSGIPGIDPPSQDLQPPAFLSGAVVMHDGGQVPTVTQAQLICGGSFPLVIDYVSPKGEFDLDISGNRGSFADASMRSNQAEGLPQRNHLGTANLSNCVVTAELAGYRSTEITLGVHSIFDSPDIGELLLTPLEGVTGYSVSATSLAAPKSARKAFEKASSLVRKPEPELRKAAKLVDQAVREYPQYAEAWDLLGRLRLAAGDDPGADEAFGRAIASDPQFMPPYPHLVAVAARAGDLERTERLGRTALRLNPYRNDVRFFMGTAQLRAGRHQEAIRTAEQIIARGGERDYPQAHQILGSAHANLGDISSAARSFRRFLELDPDATAAAAIRKQLAVWERR